MKIANPFVVLKFKNPSGEIAYRVSGRINGERIRKNVATRAEADVESQVLAVQRLQAEAGGIRTAITRLTDSQLRKPRPRSRGSANQIPSTTSAR